MIAVPLYFQVTAKASYTVAGAHLFPAVAGNAVGGILSGIIIKRCVEKSLADLWLTEISKGLAAINF